MAFPVPHGSSNAMSYVVHYFEWLDNSRRKVGQLFPLLSDKVFDFVSALPDTDNNNYDILKKSGSLRLKNLNWNRYMLISILC